MTNMYFQYPDPFARIYIRNADNTYWNQELVCDIEGILSWLQGIMCGIRLYLCFDIRDLHFSGSMAGSCASMPHNDSDKENQ